MNHAYYAIAVITVVVISILLGIIALRTKNGMYLTPMSYKKPLIVLLFGVIPLVYGLVLIISDVRYPKITKDRATTLATFVLWVLPFLSLILVDMLYSEKHMASKRKVLFFLIALITCSLVIGSIYLGW